jgi:hypothetical protein
MDQTFQRRQDERSLSELFSDATRESGELVRKEIELAKLEITDTIAQVKAGIVSLMIAVPLLFAGLLVLLVAVVLGIDRFLQQPWLSALLVGSAVTLTGLLALAGGRRRVQQVDLMPHQSAESLRDDKDMLQRHLGQGR